MDGLGRAGVSGGCSEIAHQCDLSIYLPSWWVESMDLWIVDHGSWIMDHGSCLTLLFEVYEAHIWYIGSLGQYQTVYYFIAL